jgi:hypothetical protein
VFREQLERIRKYGNQQHRVSEYRWDAGDDGYLLRE